ncbi:hypothetical protein FOZ63_027617 [Perkinsus olseni]|uniref:Uncharacterized protein n=1 Tax=Perkinsus olseni TaxID=32597 RepID=A0A7J6PPD8_PEROL|nr:hypothetical protein FOZ63_027617 [Perkinsus olseni]
MHNLIRFLTNGCSGGACDAAALRPFTTVCGERNRTSPAEEADEEDEYEPVSEEVASDGVPEWNDLIVPRFDTASSSPSYHGRNRSHCGDSFDGSSTLAESPREPTTGPDDKRKLRVSCDIMDIVDVLRAEDSLVTLEYPTVQDSLTADDMGRMIFLQVYHHALEDIETVGFLETSRQARETFLTAVNILQIYTQAAIAGADGD